MMMMLDLHDTGLRYTHYRELLDLWESALACLDTFEHVTLKATEKRKQLTAAIETLKKQIEVLSDYEGRRWYLRKAVETAHEEVAHGSPDHDQAHA